MNLAALTDLLVANWEAEEAGDFPRLRQMPSTVVRKFLRYWATVPGAIGRPFDAGSRAAAASRSGASLGRSRGPKRPPT